jgi:hypothetical protein
MNSFEFELKVPAQTGEEATEKMQAVQVFLKKLNVKELKNMARILQHDPIKTALAKKYLS